MQKIQLSSFKIFMIILAMIIIAPQYIYVIGDVNIVNALAVVLLLFYMTASKIYLVKPSALLLSVWSFYAVYCIQCLVTVSIFKFITYTILYIILPYLLYGLLNSKERFYCAIDMMIRFGTCLGIYGIFEELMGYNFLTQFVKEDVEIFREVRYGLLRITGTFGHPIGHGLFHVFMVSLILYRMSMTGTNKRRLKLSYVICMINVFLTVSRIPILAVVALHLLLLTRISGKKAVKYIVFGLAALAVLVCGLYAFNIRVPLVDDLVQTVILLVNGELSSGTTVTVGVGNRFDLWGWVTSSMKDKWVTGYGLDATFAYKTSEWTTKRSIENQYLNILYYNGLVGLIPMLLSFVGVLRATRKKKTTLAEEKELTFNSISFLLMLLYYICHFGTQESDMTRMYVIYIIFIFSYNRILGFEEKQEKRITV